MSQRVDRSIEESERTSEQSQEKQMSLSRDDAGDGDDGQ